MEQNLLDAIDLQLLDALQRDASISNVALAEKVNVSPPTCLRRVKRLTDGGWIERQVAVLARRLDDETHQIECPRSKDCNAFKTCSDCWAAWSRAEAEGGKG